MCLDDFYVVSLTIASWDLSQVTESVDVKLELQFWEKLCATVHRLCDLSPLLHKKSAPLELIRAIFGEMMRFDKLCCAVRVDIISSE